MAKKKKGSARSKKEEQDPEDELLQSLADSFGSLSLEEMHEMLDSIAAKAQNFPLSGWSGNLPKRLDEARAIYDSADSDPESTTEASRQAIAICPEFMEGYLSLAEYESNPSVISQLYRSAADKGKWMIEVQDGQSIWSSPFAQFYVSYRIHMSDHLWNFGQRVDAIEHMNEICDLDPDDESCCRFRLAFRLFDIGWDDELSDLLSQPNAFNSETAEHLLKAMRKYQADARSEEAKIALKHCYDANPLLIDFLIGDQMLPMEESHETEDYLTEEAVVLGQLALPTIRGLAGFTRWIRETLDLRRNESPPTKEERDMELRYLEGLPQSDETWAIEIPTVDSVWILFVYSIELEEPVRVETFIEKPSVAVVWEVLLDTMRDPKGEPRRPSKVLFNKKTFETKLRKRCKQLDIDCSFADDFQIPELVINEFIDMMSRSECTLIVNDALIEEVLELPQEDQTWVVGTFQPPLWITDNATPRRPFVTLVIDCESGMVLMQDMADTLRETFVSETLVKAMLNPLLASAPQRPRQIVFHPETELGNSAEILSRCGVEIIEGNDEHFDLVEECNESLIRHVSGVEGRKALLDADGIEPEELDQLFHSVARFWKLAPWRTVPGDRPIEILCDALDGSAWYAIIVGQLGMNLGLVLYDKKESMERIMKSDGENVDPDGIFLNYVEKFEIPAIDLWFQERFGWPVASEEAYPLIERALPKLQHRRPTRLELAILDVALKIIPPLIARPESRESLQLTLSSFDGRTTVEARWL